MTCLSLLTSGCEDVDVMLAAEAVKGLAVQAAQFSDSQNKIATTENKYHQRLIKLTDRHDKHGDYVFNFKVYVTSEINAFAMADGTIRIYSGLMEMMDDGDCFLSSAMRWDMW